MWTLENFQPYAGKETVGYITAVWNAGQPDEFRYNGTVNLDIQSTVDDFIEEAKKAMSAQAFDHSARIAQIQTQLNQQV